MSDLVEQLRRTAQFLVENPDANICGDILSDAADEIERLRRVTSVFGQPFESEKDRIQKVPGSYVWYDLTGTVEVDGEKWHGRLFFIAAARWINDDLAAGGPNFSFYVDPIRYGWNETLVCFASPLGNLTIDPIEGVIR